MSAVQFIHDMVRTGRITPEHGALLFDLRKRIERARRPWWQKAAEFIGRLVFG